MNLVELRVDVPELGQLGQAVVPPQRVVVRQTSVATCKGITQVIFQTTATSVATCKGITQVIFQTTATSVPEISHRTLGIALTFWHKNSKW